MSSPVLVGEGEPQPWGGAERCLGLTDHDESGGKVEGKCVRVTGDGDRAVSRAPGPGRSILDKSSGDSPAATLRMDKQVLKLWPAIRPSGHGGEAHELIAATHHTDAHPGATLD